MDQPKILLSNYLILRYLRWSDNLTNDYFVTAVIVFFFICFSVGVFTVIGCTKCQIYRIIVWLLLCCWEETVSEQLLKQKCWRSIFNNAYQLSVRRKKYRSTRCRTCHWFKWWREREQTGKQRVWFTPVKVGIYRRKINFVKSNKKLNITQTTSRTEWWLRYSNLWRLIPYERIRHLANLLSCLDLRITPAGVPVNHVLMNIECCSQRQPVRLYVLSFKF